MNIPLKFKKDYTMMTPTLHVGNHFPQVSIEHIGSIIKQLDDEILKLKKHKFPSSYLSDELSINIENEPVNNFIITPIAPIKYCPIKISEVNHDDEQENNIETTSKLLIKSNNDGFNLSRYKVYRSRARQASKNEKIFTVYGGYVSVRNALVERGWIEKLPPTCLKHLQIQSLHTLLKYADNGNKYEIAALSKLVQSYPVNFLWAPRNVKDSKTSSLSYRNRIYRSKILDFTTKEGLMGCIENSHWHTIEGISEIQAPRYHSLADPDEYGEFLRDYRTTYCLSLLKFIVENWEEIFEKNGSISVDIIKFAKNRMKAEIEFRVHDDLNKISGCMLWNEEMKSKDQDDWDAFYSVVNKLIDKQAQFKLIGIDNVINCVEECKSIIAEMMNYWPRMSSDGYNNLWILKPGSSCRGNGIVIKQNIYDIVNFAKRRSKQRYIVQKYIERPLLIYKTKFDIRQYILLTITNNKFNIWMYKNCYLRFSSEEYQLDDLKESVHITNNAVQKKYENDQRNNELPSYNMWSLDEFQRYLNEREQFGTWSMHIYPGMMKNIIGIVLASLEATEIIPNSFELYGCDFMLDENFTPILIEINAAPDMSKSTPVTEKLCPQVLEDVVKIVLDYPNNLNCSSGLFELIYNIDHSMPLNEENILKMDVTGKNARTIRFLCRSKQMTKKRLHAIDKKTLSQAGKKFKKQTESKKTKNNKLLKSTKMSKFIKSDFSNQHNKSRDMNWKLAKKTSMLKKSKKKKSKITVDKILESKLYPGRTIQKLNKLCKEDMLILKINRPDLLSIDDKVLENCLKY